MSRRIGEKLIADGLVTPEQIEEALQNQLLSGGTIGTSLLDLGLVDEDSLGKTLASLLRVGWAGRDRLRDIPVHVIAQLPGKLAEKHLAIPIDFDQKTLQIAAVHPKLLGSLSRVTGFKITTWVAPEVRIYEALENYYGIPMRSRHARIIRDLDERSASEVRKMREMAAAAATASAVLEPRVEDEQIDLPEEFGYGRNWRSVAAELEGDPGERAADERRKASGPSIPPITCRRVEDVYERFCDANFKEELSEAVLDYLAQSFKTCMLFGVRSQLAHVWDFRGKKLSADVLKKVRLPVAGGSIFSLLLGRSHYRGEPDDDDVTRTFYGLLHVDRPREVLLLPVYVHDRLVAVVYGDNGDQPIEGDTQNLRLLAEKLSAAFNLLILKRKIRS